MTGVGDGPSAAVSLRSRLAGLLLRALGKMLQRRGNAGMALACFREAAKLQPSDVQAQAAIGRICFANDDLEAADRAFRAALAGDPGNADLHNILGVTLERRWLLDEAEACYRDALHLRPAFPAALNNLGNLHRYRNRSADAENCYRQALAADPDYAEAHTNLAIALGELGRLDEAEQACRTALRLRPAFPGALNNLATILMSQGRKDEAELACREALVHDPDLPEAQVNLAVLRNDTARLASAIPYLEQQVHRRPDSAVAHEKLGQALQAQGRYDEAQQAFQKAFDLDPDAFHVLSQLGNNHVFQGDMESALQCYRKVIAARPMIGAQQSYAFYAHNLPGLSPQDIFDIHLGWATQYADPLLPVPVAHSNLRDAARKLRVGYVSADFYRHSVAYFIEPVLKNHDTASFEIYCYSNVAEPDHVTERLRSIPDIKWREVRLKTHEELAELIRQDGIDILVDLAGHTSGSRLLTFARKPAPVQVTYLGYPDTTGLKAMDYRITDSLADPPGRTERFHTEQLVRMPNSFLVYLPAANAPEVAPSPHEAKGYVTFGSFNNIGKVNRDVVALWSKVLHAVPGSRLLLKSFAFSSAKAKERYAAMFADQGIGKERIDLLAFVPDVANHLDLYREIDIALDPFPYNGTTTTCEALWMGVPVITLAGSTHVSRVGVSLLTNIGLQACIAADQEDYLHKAVALASDLARVKELRASIRGMLRESPLGDDAGFTRALEASYREMWTKWCSRGRRPG